MYSTFPAAHPGAAVMDDEQKINRELRRAFLFGVRLTHIANEITPYPSEEAGKFIDVLEDVAFRDAIRLLLASENVKYKDLVA